MGKLSKYILSILLCGSCFIGCEKVQEVETSLDEAQLLGQRKNYPQSTIYRQDLTSKLIALRPENAEYYQSKSMANTKIGDFHIAFPLLEKAYSLDPKEMGYYYGWLLLYYYRDYDRAIEKLIEYDNFTPNQADFAWGEHVNYLKGLCYKQLNQYQKAIEEFDTVIRLEGEHVDNYAFVYRGICKMQLNELQDAISDFQLAIDGYKENSLAYFYLGLAHQKLGNIDQAKNNYSQAIELLEKGYIYRMPYHEAFDAVSAEMAKDYLKALEK